MKRWVPCACGTRLRHARRSSRPTTRPDVQPGVPWFSRRSHKANRLAMREHVQADDFIGGLGRHRMSSTCPFQPGILRGLEKVTASVTAGNFRPSHDSEPPTKNQSACSLAAVGAEGKVGRVQDLKHPGERVDCGTRRQASGRRWTALFQNNLTHAFRSEDGGHRCASSASERTRCRTRSACDGPAR